MTTLMERRAAKIKALEEKQAEDMAKALVLAAADELKALVRKGLWNAVDLKATDIQKLVGPYNCGASGG
jgi:hypothetical protein